MASTKEYLNIILDRFSDIDGISYKKILDEYELIYKGTVFGWIYNDNFFVKPLISVCWALKNAINEKEYSQKMVQISEFESTEFYKSLIEDIKLVS